MRSVVLHSARAVAFLALVITTACSSGTAANTAATPTGGAATPAEGTHALRVANTHSSGETLRLFLAPEVGERRLLGTVAAAATFNAPFTGTRGRYRYVAERETGSFIESPYFDVQLPGVYFWDIALNRVSRRDR